MTSAVRKALDALDPRLRNTALEHAAGKSLPQAMLAAGYSPKYANAAGPTYLKENKRFMAAVNALIMPTVIARVKDIEINANSTLMALAAIAHADLSELIDPVTNTFRKLHDMPDYIRRAIQEIRLDGDGKLVAVKIASKPQALMMLARSQNLLDQPIPPPPPNEDRVAGLTQEAAVELIKRRAPGLLERPKVGETPAPKPVNGNGKSNGGNEKAHK